MPAQRAGSGLLHFSTPALTLNHPGVGVFLTTTTVPYMRHWQPTNPNNPNNPADGITVIVKAPGKVPVTAYRDYGVWYYAGTTQQLTFEPTHFMVRGSNGS